LYFRVWWTYTNRIAPSWKYRNDSPELRPIQLPPSDNLLWTLAVFSRALRFIRTAAETRDRNALRLSSRLAYALHNEPSHLLQYDPNAHWRFIPPLHETRGGIPAELRDHMTEDNTPANLFSVCEQIFSMEDAEIELRLTTGAADIDLAPPLQFRLYIYMLYQACLAIRPIRVQQSGENFTDDEERYIRLTMNISHLLQPIPAALVHWNQFDEQAFHRETRPDWSEDPIYLHSFCSIFRPAKWQVL